MMCVDLLKQKEGGVNTQNAMPFEDLKISLITGSIKRTGLSFVTFN